MLTIDQKSFQNDVLNSPEPVLVDFWAPWCGPCRMVAPVIEEIATEYTGKIKVGKINVDDNPELAEKYGILSIPTICLFAKGEIVSRMVGFKPKKEIAVEIDGLLK